MRSYGLSLSDQYWIRPAGSGLDWADVNFFDNGFSDDMGDLLFGKEVWQGSLDLASPDNASDGLLMKRWKIIGGKRYLMKSGTMPFMQEPFNEVMASITPIPSGYRTSTTGSSSMRGRSAAYARIS